MRYKSISHGEIIYNQHIFYREEKMRIRDIREDRDLTQKQIADFLHIRQNTYSQYENGHRQIPVEILVKLAQYYNTSVDYLLGMTDETKPYK